MNNTKQMRGYSSHIKRALEFSRGLRLLQNMPLTEALSICDNIKLWINTRNSLSFYSLITNIATTELPVLKDEKKELLIQYLNILSSNISEYELDEFIRTWKLINNNRGKEITSIDYQSIRNITQLGSLLLDTKRMDHLADTIYKLNKKVSCTNGSYEMFTNTAGCLRNFNTWLHGRNNKSRQRKREKYANLIC